MLSKLLLLGIFLIGLVMRVTSLDQSLWLDEATSILVSRDFTFSDILTKFSPGDFHPPLYYLLLKIWILVFGASEIGARSFSVAAGMVSIIFIYLVGRKLFSEKVGIIGALLLSTAPLHIYYSQEARMYVLAGLFTLILIWFFQRILDRSRWVDWMGFLVSGVLLIYTDYPAALIFLFAIFYLLFFERSRSAKHKFKWLGMYAAIAASFLIWIPTLYNQLSIGMQVKTNLPGWWATLGGVNLKQIALIPVKFMIGRISLYDKGFYALGIIGVSSLFIIAAKNALIDFRKSKFLLAWLLVPLVAAMIIGLKLSVFSYFRFLFLLPAFYLIVAYGVVHTKKQRVNYIVLACVVIVNILLSGVYLTRERFHREDWKSAVSWIETNSEVSSAAIFIAKSQRDAYKYYSQTIPSYGPEGIFLGFQTVWLVRYSQPIFDPQDKLPRNLENVGYEKIEEKDFNGVVIWKYQKKEPFA